VKGGSSFQERYGVGAHLPLLRALMSWAKTEQEQVLAGHERKVTKVWRVSQVTAQKVNTHTALKAHGSP